MTRLNPPNPYHPIRRPGRRIRFPRRDCALLFLILSLLPVAPASLRSQDRLTPERLTNRRFGLLNDATAIGWNPAMLATSADFDAYDLLAGIGFDSRFTARTIPYGLFAKTGPLAVGLTGVLKGDSTDLAHYYAGIGLPLGDRFQLGASVDLTSNPGGSLLDVAEFTASAIVRPTDHLFGGITIANLTGNNGRAARFAIEGAYRNYTWGTFYGGIQYDRADTVGGVSPAGLTLGASLGLLDGDIALSGTYDLLKSRLRLGAELFLSDLGIGAIGDWSGAADPPFTGGVALLRYAYDPADTVAPPTPEAARPVSAQGWAPNRSYVPDGIEYKFATPDAPVSHDAVVKPCGTSTTDQFDNPAGLMRTLWQAGGPYMRLAQKLQQLTPDQSDLFGEIARQYYSQETVNPELQSGDSLAIVSRSGYSIGIQSVDYSQFPQVSVVMQVTAADGRNVRGLDREEFAFRDSTLQILSVTPVDANFSVPVDLVLLIDCSGSMGDEIMAVQQNVSSFLRNMEDRGADYRIGGVLYGSIVYDTLHPTADLEKFRKFAGHAAPIGNDEISTLSIKEATRMNFRPDAQRVFILITDDWVVQDNSRLTEADLTEMLWKNSARLYTIINPCRNNSAVMTRLTLGREYNIGSSFNSILDDIGADITTTYRLVYESRLTRKDVGIVEPTALLRGRILDEQGRPMAAQILLRDSDGRRLRQVETDPHTGEYRVGLDEGVNYTVQINAARFQPLAESIDGTTVHSGDTILHDFTMRRMRTAVSGYVFDEEGRPVAAGIDVVDAATSQSVAMVRTDVSGYYRTELDEGRTYRLTPVAPGYTSVVTALDARDAEPGTQIRQDLHVTTGAPPPPPPAENPILEQFSASVFFNFDKWAIRPQAFPVLDKVVTYLGEHPAIHIEIEAHTDASGDPTYNQGLSERRAESVMEYLVKKGIDASRLTATGYGESRPIASNATAAGRAKNRRVEFHIVEQE